MGWIERPFQITYVIKITPKLRATSGSLKFSLWDEFIPLPNRGACGCSTYHPRALVVRIS